MADQVANAYDPPAVYFYQYGAYFAPCDAQPPDTYVIIEGYPVKINATNLMYPNLVDEVTGYCATGITTGGAGPYILGDVFLQNTYTLFDIGAAQIKFYPRTPS